MSVEEEVEIKDLIAQTLKSNGTLAKIKAHLRASIFLALDEDEQISKQKPLLNNKIKSFGDSDEVYEPESYLEYNYQQEEKQRLLNQFGLGNVDNNEPVLYQLIKIAQKSRRTLEVNLNINGSMHQEKSDSVLSESESVSVPENICSDSNSEERSKENLKIKSNKTEHILDTTFDVHSPLLSKVIKHNDTCEPPIQNKEVLKDSDNVQIRKDNDDTYDDTSSLCEDIDSINHDSNSKVPEIRVNGIEEKINDKLSDKPKLSPPKSDKLKSKSNLSSLSDLPPLNKSRVSDILPSLYNKDFKDKSNLRELDKLFDMDAEYEEDFMYSGDDLSLKSDHGKGNLLEELQSNKANKEKTAILGKKDAKHKTPGRIIADCKFKTPANSQKNKTVCDSTETNCVSENLESTSENL